MAKISDKYEILYIINPTLDEEGIKAIVEKFKAMVEAEGTLTSIEEWGKRRLAYPINDLNEGYYVLMTCEAKPELPAEIDRVMKITENVMRSLITAVEAEGGIFMLNHIVLMGRLTRDPELRRTGSGISVASFTLAVDRDFASKDARESGERETDFIDIVAWRSTADFVSRYFTKGRMAVVTGRLQIRNWTDKEGNKRRSAEVVADNVYFGDS